ncbi:MAG: DUF554 domain-containing protein [Oscillospiraceae bacterium]|nr:DUF554 domain-containing protein [Oscillospiraceae bacterium]
MPGLGTLINMLGIVLGGLTGLVGRRFISERYRNTLMKSAGVCIMFIGIGGVMSKMLYISGGELDTQGTMITIGSFALGSLIGEWLNIELRIERFGQWLKRRTGNADDASFVGGFVSASFTVCIGAMAIVGALEEGMRGDISTLVMKAALDFLIIMVMSASLGKGCIFAAIPVGIWQWSITLLAQALSLFMTDAALDYISLTGSALIFCVGANLIWENKFKVANVLPTVLVAAVIGLI